MTEEIQLTEPKPQTSDASALLDPVGRLYLQTMQATLNASPDERYGLVLLAYLCQRAVRHGEHTANDPEFRPLVDEYYPPRKPRKKRAARNGAKRRV